MRGPGIRLKQAFDNLPHLQLVIDPSSKSCRVILQVVGEAPRPLCHASLSRTPAGGDSLGIELFCGRSKTQTDGPAFDNLRVTRRNLKGPVHV